MNPVNVTGQTVSFPRYSGVRCLMMPYVQGDPDSVPDQYAAYRNILESIFIERGKIGYLTIDESPAAKGQAHRGARARYGRALHTEAGLRRCNVAAWGEPCWGGEDNVLLDRDARFLLANNLDGSCAVWNAVHTDTSLDGDIGYAGAWYPYSQGYFMKSGQVVDISIFTPHESIPVAQDFNRQFLRIGSSKIHGREPYFTQNPLL